MDASQKRGCGSLLILRLLPSGRIQRLGSIDLRHLGETHASTAHRRLQSRTPGQNPQGRPRDELLNRGIFSTLQEADVLIGRRRLQLTTGSPPHRSPLRCPPAPRGF